MLRFSASVVATAVALYHETMRLMPLLALLMALWGPETAWAGPKTEQDAIRMIDQQVTQAWRRAGITPAPLVDDAGFLRRAHQDLLGTIPTPAEVLAFLKSRAPDRRRLLIDRLLADPRHAAHFTDYWESVLFARARRTGPGPNPGIESFRAWLSERLHQGAGWDHIVTELLTATGSEGPVSFLLQYENAPHDLSGVVARELLGVQIQCAQCHDHPTERWRQADFRRFAATFSRLRVTREDPAPAKGPRRLVLSSTPRPVRGPRGSEQAEIAAAHPTALDGTDLASRPDADPRTALAAWMTSPKNPWFARVLVNRYWAYFIGRGFVEPIDDLRPGNPNALPALLDRLAADFAQHGFDTRRLIRLLCKSRPYQLAAQARGNDREAARLFARHPLRPLGPVELFDHIVLATGFDEALSRAAPDAERLARIRAALRRSVAFTFDVDEEIAPPDFTGTVQQELMLTNGSLINLSAAAVPGGLIEALSAAARPDAALIEELFLRVLSRRPRRQELDRFLAFLAAPRELTPDQEGARRPARVPPGEVLAGPRRPVAPDPLRGLAGKLRSRRATVKTQALEDVLWALLNSSEFTFRH